MKYYIYLGSTTDGQEHWLEGEKDKTSIIQPEENERCAARRREYYPFLEPL